MGRKIEVKAGDRYGSWEVIKELDKKWAKSRVFLCKCLECGKEYEKRLDDLRQGNTLMCRSCNNKKTWTKHGLANHPIYHVFKDMHKRCEYEKHKSYKEYGARGIKVCKEWEDTEEGLTNFYNWCMSHGYEKGLQLDRFNNNKGYSPDNCRFVTVSQNNFNRRNVKGYGKRGNRWRAYIRKDGKMYEVYCDTEEDAKEVRQLLELKYYGENTQNYRNNIDKN